MLKRSRDPLVRLALAARKKGIRLSAGQAISLLRRYKTLDRIPVSAVTAYRGKMEEIRSNPGGKTHLGRYATNKKNTFIDVAVGYTKGGVSMAESLDFLTDVIVPDVMGILWYGDASVQRGYYLQVTPIEIKDGFEYLTPFKGYRKFLLSATAKSDRKEERAIAMAMAFIQPIVDHIASEIPWSDTEPLIAVGDLVRSNPITVETGHPLAVTAYRGKMEEIRSNPGGKTHLGRYATNKENTFIEVTVSYTKGGASMGGDASVQRGYYLHVTPIEIKDGFKYMTLFKGYKRFLLSTTAKSDRKEEQAVAMAMGFIQSTESYANFLIRQMVDRIASEESLTVVGDLVRSNPITVETGHPLTVSVDEPVTVRQKPPAVLTPTSGSTSPYDYASDDDVEGESRRMFSSVRERMSRDYARGNPPIRWIRGDRLSSRLQQEALNRYVHRFTGNHRPSWVDRGDADYHTQTGQHYLPQYDTDREWLAGSTFGITRDGRFDSRVHHLEPASWHSEENPSGIRLRVGGQSVRGWGYEAYGRDSHHEYVTGHVEAANYHTALLMAYRQVKEGGGRESGKAGRTEQFTPVRIVLHFPTGEIGYYNMKREFAARRNPQDNPPGEPQEDMVRRVELGSVMGQRLTIVYGVRASVEHPVPDTFLEWGGSRVNIDSGNIRPSVARLIPHAYNRATAEEWKPFICAAILGRTVTPKSRPSEPPGEPLEPQRVDPALLDYDSRTRRSGARRNPPTTPISWDEQIDHRIP